MIDILEKYPTPWKVLPARYIEAANGEMIVLGLDLGLLEFIVEIVNNSVRPRITDAPCECPACNWQGTIWDCESDIDEGSLQCPKCLTIIKVYA